MPAKSSQADLRAGPTVHRECKSLAYGFRALRAWPISVIHATCHNEAANMYPWLAE
jgi:hypothetical protein